METREERLGGPLTLTKVELATISELQARTKLWASLTAMLETVGMIFLQKLKEHK